MVRLFMADIWHHNLFSMESRRQRFSQVWWKRYIMSNLNTYTRTHSIFSTQWTRNSNRDPISEMQTSYPACHPPVQLVAPLNFMLPKLLCRITEVDWFEGFLWRLPLYAGTIVTVDRELGALDRETLPPPVALTTGVVFGTSSVAERVVAALKVCSNFSGKSVSFNS